MTRQQQINVLIGEHIGMKWWRYIGHEQYRLTFDDPSKTGIGWVICERPGPAELTPYSLEENYDFTRDLNAMFYAEHFHWKDPVFRAKYTEYLHARRGYEPCGAVHVSAEWKAEAYVAILGLKLYNEKRRQETIQEETHPGTS